jgi:hypothetical protein
MRDLGADRGFVLHGGPESYSLGDGIRAVQAAWLLADVRRVAATLRDCGSRA